MNLFSKLLLAFCIVCMPLASGGSAQPSIPLDGMFLQPWESDLDVSRQAWRERMEALNRAGITTLLLQWNAYGETDFLTKKTAFGESLPDHLMTIADELGMKVVLGLYADPDFFTSIKQPPAEVRAHLKDIRERSIELAGRVSQQLGAHDSFAGWYLPEEIDDESWRAIEKKDTLKEHFAETARALRAIRLDVPIYFSAFFTGKDSPPRFAGLLNELTKQSALVVLVQDGFGATDLSPFDSELYIQHIATSVSSEAWQLIVELFEKAKADEFTMTSMERLQIQSDLARKYNKKALGFSLKYYFENSK